MYNNIGEKIKNLSKTLAVIEAVLAIIIGSIELCNYNNFEEFIISILIIVIGCLAAWLLGFPLGCSTDSAKLLKKYP